MTDIDLDAMERGRLEVLPKARHGVKFRGKRFVLPPELPIEFGMALREGDMRLALVAVLDGKVDEFLALKPSQGDFNDLVNAISELYTGREPGESPASGSSSKRTSTRSRPTSSATTS